MQGWVKLHRSLFENELWLSQPFTKAQAWIDLFANANHEDGSFYIRGNLVRVKRGQIAWSELTMMERWKWSRNKTRLFLSYLEKKVQQIEQQKSHLTTLITIVNYERYQSENLEKVQQEVQQKDSRRYTNKNVKNEKKDTGVASPPEKTFDPQGAEIIKAFEVLNPACKNYYGNTAQRKACDQLIQTYSLERTLSVISKTLPKTNLLDYFPRITTPYQLWEKWSQLESQIRSKQLRPANEKPNTVAFK